MPTSIVVVQLKISIGEPGWPSCSIGISWKKNEFRDDCPKNQKFEKTDLAAYLVAWGGEPQKVCFGAQKNFNYFMNKLDEFVPAGQEPDPKFYRDAVSIGILYEEAARAAEESGDRGQDGKWVKTEQLEDHACPLTATFGPWPNKSQTL